MLLNYSIVVKKQSFVSKDGFNNGMVSQILSFFFKKIQVKLLIMMPNVFIKR